MFDQITCLVFDMECLWMEVVPVATLIKRQKEQNPNLDCTETLIDQTLLAGCNPNYSANVVEGRIHFAAKYYLDNYPI
uniref:XLF-like N-terminal domain-containing protein n=1 Tax=Anopheles funestus TaxID=62324 RepID=A0A182S2T3_ANOFN